MQMLAYDGRTGLAGLRHLCNARRPSSGNPDVPFQFNFDAEATGANGLGQQGFCFKDKVAGFVLGHSGCL